MQTERCAEDGSKYPRQDIDAGNLARFIADGKEGADLDGMLRCDMK